MRYVKAGDALMRTLILQVEGMKYLMENQLFVELAASLNRLDPVGHAQVNRCYSSVPLDSGWSIARPHFYQGKLGEDAFRRILYLDRDHEQIP